MDQISRRSFFANVGGASFALWFGISVRSYAGKTPSADITKKFTSYIKVESNGNIIIYNTKPQMGQSTFQSIPALIAEEFEVSLEQVIIELANGEKGFCKGQHAGGSSSIRTGYTELRKVGASAKEVFIQAASIKWQVDPSSCFAENGKVIHKTTKKALAYGELVEAASKLELPKVPKLKDPKKSRIWEKFKRSDIPIKDLLTNRLTCY